MTKKTELESLNKELDYYEIEYNWEMSDKKKKNSIRPEMS